MRVAVPQPRSQDATGGDGRLLDELALYLGLLRRGADDRIVEPSEPPEAQHGNVLLPGLHGCPTLGSPLLIPHCTARGYRLGSVGRHAVNSQGLRQAGAILHGHLTRVNNLGKIQPWEASRLRGKATQYSHLAVSRIRGGGVVLSFPDGVLTQVSMVPNPTIRGGRCPFCFTTFAPGDTKPKVGMRVVKVLTFEDWEPGSTNSSIEIAGLVENRSWAKIDCAPVAVGYDLNYAQIRRSHRRWSWGGSGSRINSVI